METTIKHPIDDIVSVKRFCELHPYLCFNRDRFEYLLRNKHKNGIIESGAIVKVGKEYMLKNTEFCDWYYRYININGRDG